MDILFCKRNMVGDIMKNKKYLLINLLLVLARKIILIVLYFAFLKKNTHIETNLFYVLFDGLGFGSGLQIALYNMVFFFAGYVNVQIIFFGYLLFLIIYLFIEYKKEKPNNIKLLILTIVHGLMMALYIYSSYIRVII